MSNISFIVKFTSGQCVSVSLPPSATFADVKAKLCADNDELDEQEMKDGVAPVTKQDPDAATLYLGGKPMKDGATLAEAGVREEAVLHFKWTGGIKIFSECEIAAVANSEARDMAVMVSLKAPMIMDVQRVPIDLCLVVDRSGSMSSLMSLVIDTICFMVKQLQKGDRLSIVEYDNKVTTCLGLTSMDDSGKQRAQAAARTLSPRGGTNLSDGLFAGMQLVQDRPAGGNDVASVLLFTDGQANDGLRTKGEIVQKMLNPAFISAFKPAKSDNMMPRRSYAPAPKRKSKVRSPSFLQNIGSSIGNFFSAEEKDGGENKTKKKTKKNQAAAPSQFTVNTFGFGTNHNADLLKAISEAGNVSRSFLRFD
jgi:hypothetical protein